MDKENEFDSFTHFLLVKANHVPPHANCHLKITSKFVQNQG